MVESPTAMSFVVKSAPIVALYLDVNLADDNMLFNNVSRSTNLDESTLTCPRHTYS